jgi:hypothetical protein
MARWISFVVILVNCKISDDQVEEIQNFCGWSWIRNYVKKIFFIRSRSCSTAP